MTKLREIADKLGLPIRKPFRIDDSDLVFRINDLGQLLFYRVDTDNWIISAYNLEYVYTKGFTLVDFIKPKREEVGLHNSEYLKGISNILKEYKESLEEELNKTQSVFEIQENKDTRNLIEMLIKETERRLLNK